MKKILFIFLIGLIGSLLFSQENGEIIDSKWVKIKFKVRSNYKKTKLAQIDSQTLDALENSQIPEDVEPELSELLYDIVNDNVLYGRDNALRAVEILYGKFKDKRHFFDVASEYAYSNPNGDFMILSKIFIGMADLIEGHYIENMRALKVIYESMRVAYLLPDKGGLFKYGTTTVIKYYIAYLRKYLKLVNDGKIEEDPKYKYLITYMYNDLNLESQTSDFIKIEGAEELKQEYFFLNEKQKNSSSTRSKE